MGGIAFDLYKRKCAQCGKTFEGGTDWAYKDRYIKGKKESFRYFCSWKCLRTYREGGLKGAKSGGVRRNTESV